MMLKTCCCKGLPLHFIFPFTNHEDLNSLLQCIRQYNESSNWGGVRLSTNKLDAEDFLESTVPSSPETFLEPMVGSPLVCLERRKLKDGRDIIAGRSAIGRRYLEAFFKSRGGHQVEVWEKKLHEPQHNSRSIPINFLDGSKDVDRASSLGYCLGSLYSAREVVQSSSQQLSRLLRFVGWPAVEPGPDFKKRLASAALCVLGYQSLPSPASSFIADESAVPPASSMASAPHSDGVVNGSMDIDELVAMIESGPEEPVPDKQRVKNRKKKERKKASKDKAKTMGNDKRDDGLVGAPLPPLDVSGAGDSGERGQLEGSNELEISGIGGERGEVQEEQLAEDYVEGRENQEREDKEEEEGQQQQQGEEEEVPLSLVCPITLAVMKEPVMAQDYHTYERTVIEGWIRKAKEANVPLRSPLTNEVMGSMLVPNHLATQVINEYLENRKHGRGRW